MIMENRARRLAEPLRWGRRERVVTATLLAVALLVLAGLGAYALTSGAPARRDCIEVTFASTLGGATLHACGTQARKDCDSGSFRAISDELRLACRRAGFPYRAPS
jgi:hypothetical protein